MSANPLIGDQPFRLPDTPVENLRALKVIVIGAGYSGVYCGIRIPERIPNVELVIYEKNAGIGGTWWENRYPGCACDIPADSYQYSFEPNVKWSSLYAPAQEIQAYIESTAKRYGADRFIKLLHQVQECWFEQSEGKWHVRVKNLSSGDIFEDTAEILINARGGLNEIAWPEIEGLQDFRGEVMHSAKWNEQYDFANKKVGVIGSGSSAIQIIPQLQKIPGTQLSCFIRSKVWITPPFSQGLWDKLGLNDQKLLTEMKAKFSKDPEEYHRFRIAVEEETNSVHAITVRGTEMQLMAQKAFTDNMRASLAAKPEVFQSLLPSFAPGCRRLTPGSGFLESLIKPNVSLVTTAISKLEPRGVRTADDNLYEIDVLVCATGFRVAAPPSFPVRGLDNKTVASQWQHRPTSYLGLAVDGIPNYFMLMGPNTGVASGSLLTIIENIADYIIKCIRKFQKENVKTMSAKSQRVKNFVEAIDAYFPRTVFTDECPSWFRNKAGNIVGLWPGSALHCIETLRSPRWEDFDYEYVGEEDGVEINRLAWLGNGWTVNQLKRQHLAFYLYHEFRDDPVQHRPEEKALYKVRPFSY